MSEASKIADMTEVAVGNIDVGMTNLMNALSQAGISVRGMGSELTGISRDIATASEESILGLAAGINRQSFYISQVPPKLDVIIGLLQGGNLTQGSAITLQDLVTIQNQHLKQQLFYTLTTNYRKEKLRNYLIYNIKKDKIIRNEINHIKDLYNENHKTDERN